MVPALPGADSPRVSVLMPCRNARSTIERAVESLRRQTLADFEVVVVDDGSTDGTGAWLREYARRDHRFRVMRSKSRPGLVAALNEGLSRCRAPYVARMDADDIAHPRRLELQAAFLDAHPEVAVVAARVRAAGDPPGPGWRRYVSWVNRPLHHGAIVRNLLIESPLPHPSVMVRRRWYQRVGGYREFDGPEDYDLWLRMWRAGAKFARLPDVLLDWWDWPGRLTRTDPRYSPEQFLRLKAQALVEGPLGTADAVIIWGAGRIGRRLARELEHAGRPPAAFVDIDPRKIGRLRRGRPVLAPHELPDAIAGRRAIVLAAVGAPGGRAQIRARLRALGLREGRDWWAVA
ncbi:MAG: glycosyltransferase [Kiritimatiellae bacterium]|nr:glycosyltransferase [Kiritimatiellia bacterium]